MIHFISDLFVENYAGGAELTTEAIIEKSEHKVNKILAKNLNADFINEHKNDKWIFGNFTNIDHNLLLYFIAQKLDYHVIEYDYKYCGVRIPKLHKKHHGHCCENTPRGQLICAFFLNSKSLWYMSYGQKNWYESVFPILKNTNNNVLSSIFDKSSIDYFQSIDCSNKENVFLIQEHNHPLKGTKQGIEYANKNNLNYELFSGLSHKEVLEKFTKSKGFIFLPTEFDTCPRVTIEAKLLGCELILNDNVQHKDEEWFQNKNTIIPYMNERLEFFWNTI